MQFANSNILTFLIAGQNGKFWGITGDEISADAETPSKFSIELREPTRICIKTSAGQYLNADKNGKLSVGGEDSEKATKWEF